MAKPSPRQKLSAVTSKPRRSHDLQPTQNDLGQALRQQMATLLQARLCDAVDLLMQCKQAHWTVKGPHFAGLHLLFDEAHDDLRGYMDLIAERAVSLGGQIDGTVQAAASQSSLPPYPTDLRDGMGHVTALSCALAAFAERVRRGIDEAADAGDAVTADSLTQVASGLDKRLWMVEAHRQG